MRNHIIVAVIGVFLFQGFAAAGPAAPPKGFRQLTWGASPDKYLKAVTGLSTPGISLYRPRSGKRPPPLFKVPVAEEAYSFAKGKFFSASAWIDGSDNYTKIKTALVEAYGDPAASKEGDTNNFSVWKWPGSSVEVRLAYHYKFARATVTYINPAVHAPKLDSSGGAEAGTAANAVD